MQFYSNTPCGIVFRRNALSLAVYNLHRCGSYTPHLLGLFHEEHERHKILQLQISALCVFFPQGSQHAYVYVGMVSGLEPQSARLSISWPLGPYWCPDKTLIHLLSWIMHVFVDAGHQAFHQRGALVAILYPVSRQHVSVQVRNGLL